MTSTHNITFTVFSKPWHMPIPELAQFVRGLGFDGVELPVRPGYPVTPENVGTALPEAVKIFADHGLTIASVAADTREAMLAACGASGVPIVRICVGIPEGKRYLDAIADLQREWEALVPLLERHGVALGVQNHCGRCIANAMQLRHAIALVRPSPYLRRVGCGA